jgi:RimJ/RimL family protein N-acetyltransferase
MAAEDMQFGLVYTSPGYRQKKFASMLIKAILARAGNLNSYWWLTESDNFASRKLAEGAGFRLVDKAVRKSVMGFSYYTLE